MRATVATTGAERPLLRDVVCDAIREGIIDGTYQPGERLVEDRLGEQLGVSRVPVREALRMLEAEGFVEMVPHRGAVVARLSEKDVADIFDVRVALESVVARTAARNATERDVARIERLLDMASKAAERDDLPRVALLNARFHEHLLELASNQYLSDVLVPLRGRMQKLFRTTAAARSAESLEEHRSLLAAIAAHDETAAARLATKHVEAVRASVRDATS
jgi:DNA-binding GntR family transcriptional regulator